MNQVSEQSPKAFQAFMVALGVPLIWLLIYGWFGPQFPSDPPYPTNNRLLHCIFLGLGGVLWFAPVWFLRRSHSESGGITYRTWALAFTLLFALALCIGFLVRNFL